MQRGDTAGPGRLSGFVTAPGSASTSALVAVAVFALVLASRTPSLLLHPRFWAEEGPVYYGSLQTMAPLKGLVRVFNGNYQFLTNGIVELALRVPIRYAPAVTTFASLAVGMACAWMIGRLLLSRGCSRLAASCACAMFALQPAGYEVFLNATNVQWVTSVIGLLLCLWDEIPATGWRAALCYLVLAVCGLTGTTTCILLPLFVVGAVVRGSRFGWCMVAVLGIVTTMQAGIVLAHRGELNRAFAISDHALLPLVFQVDFAQFVPADALDGPGNMSKPHTGVVALRALQWAAIGLGGTALIAQMASRGLGILTAGALAAGAIAVPLVNEFGAQGTADDMLSGWAGGRYFFIGASSLLILLAAAVRVPTVAGRVAAWSMIALVLFNGAVTALYAEWPLPNVAGPSFSEQIDACVGAPVCEITVWPGFYRPNLVVRMPPGP